MIDPDTMSRWYRLVDDTPMQLTWGEFIADPGGIMGQPDVTWLRLPDGRSARVSTVYLGLDHRHDDDGPPVLWETMVFSDEDDAVDQHQERYTSSEDARDGHRCRRGASAVIGELDGPAKLAFPTRRRARWFRRMLERTYGRRYYVYRAEAGRFELTTRPRCWWLSVEPLHASRHEEEELS